jgi:hypothetical protein
LTPAEIGLYAALKQIAQGRYVVFAKVALNEIFVIVRPNENVHYFNKLFRKYVDFLLCSPDSLKPRIGIEVIRTTPEGGMRDSDQFTEDMFLAAGLPLVQVRAGDRVDIAGMETMIQKALARVQQASERGASTAQDSVPMCPVCGKMMVLRTQRGGKADGRLYYGCIDNPACPGRIAVK